MSSWGNQISVDLELANTCTMAHVKISVASSNQATPNSK